MDRVVHLLARDVPGHDPLDVFVAQLVLVALVAEVALGVDEEDIRVGLVLPEHQDARLDGRAEEQVGGQLDDSVNKVVVHHVLANLALGSAAVEDAGEHDHRRGAGIGEPRQHVHEERPIGLRLRRKDTRGSEARVVDGRGRLGPVPLHRVRRVGYHHVEGLKVPVLGVGQRVAQSDVELAVLDPVQEHVDAREVVRGGVYLLTEVAHADLVVAQDLCRLQEEPGRPAAGIIHLVNLVCALRGEKREQARHLLRREELTSRLAGASRVHGHEVLVRIAEQIYLRARHVI